MTTIILGKEYVGRPMMGSLAFSIWKLEQNGQPEKAQQLLDAHNLIRGIIRGQGPVDLQDDMCDWPLEGGFAIKA